MKSFDSATLFSGRAEETQLEGLQKGSFAVLFFNANHQVLLRREFLENPWEPSVCGVSKTALSDEVVQAVVATENPVKYVFSAARSAGEELPVYFVLLTEEETETATTGGKNSSFFTLGNLRQAVEEEPTSFSASLRAILDEIEPHLLRIPYLYKKETEYNYRFRTEKQRNREVYHIDQESQRLYQSALCQAIKEVKRINERSSRAPAEVNFGAVSYLVPSHFGFCLGVQNAIERAYESLAENPGKRVFMLSELIHNPFVNEDLLGRGLRYLQSDKGEAVIDVESGLPYWDTLTSDDVVVIPAFGATNEDKQRLINKGISINQYDATCMLVEKVWKAAHRFGKAGYTVIIHGKAEHEETKATFSNAAEAGHALIIRNRQEAEHVGAAILAEDPEEKRRILADFADRYTPGFDAAKHLARIAVVNQTTLLRNETLGIISFLEQIFAKRYGADEVSKHLNTNSKGDTLCYATQVNQDALEKTLALDLDLALVAGGKNSSNTYQLFRMCEARLGARASYIQSERNILSPEKLRHYQFSLPGEKVDEMVEKSFLPSKRPVRILLTGGASCPDGIIQQIITRINSLFPPEELRSIEDVLSDFEKE